MPDQVMFNYQVNHEPLASGLWYRARQLHNFHMVCSATWPCQTSDPLNPELELIPDVVDDQGESQVLLYELEDCVVCVRLGHGSVGISAAAGTMLDARSGIKRIEAVLPRQEVEDNGRIPVTFWSYTPHGPQSHSRDLDVPRWGEIRDFYNVDERDEIEALMSEDFVPGLGGQLLLWRGIPGTGKTTALRALGHAWREWAQLHVIADPERFFGDHADYMLQVMLGAGDQDFKPAGFDKQEAPKWRILVLEDAGELLAADSKQKVGQALSRFLNAVDGLIGQGLRFLVLVTTNEDDMGQLNEAVGRHGRAAVNIEFKALEPDRAQEVLAVLRERNGKEDSEGIVNALTKGNSLPLADVFALAEGRAREEKKQSIGFLP